MLFINVIRENDLKLCGAFFLFGVFLSLPVPKVHKEIAELVFSLDFSSFFVDLGEISISKKLAKFRRSVVGCEA